MVAPNMRAVSVAAAGEQTQVVDSSGNVFVIGACAAGWRYDVPYNDETLRMTAARCRSLLPGFGLPVPRLASGSFHNLALQAGRVFSWGCDSIDVNDGQLGLLSRAELAVPTRVPVAEAVTDIAAGAHHSLILTVSGAVLSAGAGLLGQLGRKHDFSCDSVLPGRNHSERSHAHDMFLPVATPTADGEVVQHVGCGYYHSLCVSSFGRLFAFGSNSHGQCGSNVLDPAPQLESAEEESRILAPRLVQELKDQHVVQAVGGYGHTLALTREGDVWTCGLNSHGQRGHPEAADLPRCSKLLLGDAATAVAAGYSHSVVLRRDGAVLTFGENDAGQLGTSGDERPTPAVVPLPGAGRCVAIAAGNSHTVALCADGQVLSWGSGRNGQQGANSLDDVLAPQFLLL